MTKRILAVVLGTCGVIVPQVNAVQPKPIPVFALTRLDGSPVQSDALAPGEQWLILYVQPECRPCENALQLVKQKELHPNLPLRLVIIGGMPVTQLRMLAQKYPDLSQAAWMADPNQNAFRQLQLVAAPAILGLKRNTVEWNLNGVLKNTKQFTSILESWTR